MIKAQESPYLIKVSSDFKITKAVTQPPEDTKLVKSLLKKELKKIRKEIAEL